MNRILTDKEFIKIWEGSSSISEVLKSGYTYSSATSKASKLRATGINLKLFKDMKDSAYFARIGAIGGRKGHTGGFYGRSDFASQMGKIGGKISKRRSSK